VHRLAEARHYTDMKSALVDGFERGPEQQFRLLVARRPPTFAVDALPCDFELLVDQHNSLGAPAARTGYPMLVEQVMSRKASLHRQLVGSYKPVR